MISYRANLFESLNKQIPRVVFGQTWIEVIDPKSFEPFISERYANKGVPFLVGAPYIGDFQRKRITLMAASGSAADWSNRSLSFEDFQKIPKQAYKIVPSPIPYKFKIGDEVMSNVVGNKGKVVAYYCNGQKSENKQAYWIQLNDGTKMQKYEEHITGVSNS
jgi:hypothetical protein